MAQQGLYQSEYEHDACGVGFIAHIKGHKSHSLVAQALEVLKNLTHRGAVGADPLQGDGAGILIQIPDQLFRDDMKRQGVTLPPSGEYGVGMVFLPQEEASRHACQEEIERAVAAEGQIILGWRDVPIDEETPISPVVREKEPVIRQIFIGHSPDVLVTDALERKLYIIRKRCSIAIDNLHLQHCKEFYIPSLSARTIVYKGQLLAKQIGEYYKDLQDSRCMSAIALIHQRFSTNTFPQWSLAHPFRMIAHNGEINTLRGNFNWIRAREQHISSPVFGDDLQKLWPLIFQGQSDSASFDNVFELLTMSGYSMAQAAMMMIPSAWEKDKLMDPKLRAFYEYYAAMMEPWDGPAAVAFTDGRQVGATLDRNGLRPARYLITKDDLVVMASEAGVLNIDEKRVLRHWRLEPGRMLLIDTEQGRIIDDQEIKNSLATSRPYPEWIEKVRIRLSDIKQEPERMPLELNLKALMGVFGYTREDVERLIKPKAVNGKEPVVSMGNDAPLAVLSKKPRQLYDYFRQLFAQVTNPPIDPIREAMVTSLVSFIGPRPDLLNIMDNNPPVRLEVSQPILSDADMEKIRNIDAFTGSKFRSQELDITYPLSWGKDGIEARLASIMAAAVDAVKSGKNILIITDRRVSAKRLAIPALLATSAVHQCLVRHGLRTSTGLVVETGSARTVHQFALLGGYGAEAINPYAAFAVVRSLANGPEQELQYLNNYVHAIDAGLYKTMSKMGISTYMSYTGAQIFEAIGLSQEFVDTYFKNTSTQVGGVDLFDIADEAVKIHNEAFSKLAHSDLSLSSGGDLNWRYGAEEHMWTPEAVVSLQRAVRENNYETYKKYAKEINDQSKRLMTLRGMFAFKKTSSISIDEVESEESIIHRFASSAMSMGAISTEAHTALAIAMNRMGAMSNSGEGGEDSDRDGIIEKDTTLKAILGDAVVKDIPLKKGDSLRSKVRQVASGRFGVTTDYLAHADMIQIKMAQGAKPGEGGQLPGHKVSAYIGKLRHSLPGIGLISPPPHHDIYSIEDLAQLIFDLKLTNPKADISVKLVSEVGIGTVAAGVAKCKADHIVISGHDGGTGAAPASSMKYAGSAWETGLADVQQTLVMNKLRSRVTLQVDGQIKTGRDVIIGALLGADEFGFGTAPLVCLGCTMMRKCQKNTCPAGIATQDPELRAQFVGTPEMVQNYFHFVAREVREIMAELGFKNFDEMIGRADLLEKLDEPQFAKANKLSFTKIFFKDPTLADECAHHAIKQDHELEKALDNSFLKKAEKAIADNKSITIESEVKNINRSVGTMLSGYIATLPEELSDNTVTLKLHGTAGQSLGAFLSKGVTLSLCGEANDYVGKGLSGGIIAVRPYESSSCDRRQNIIAGNTCLYGATTGEVYLSGVTGERFAVRNSGAHAVCEGAGDHGCEYMTGGTVMILGKTGRNFGAGMSGGIAYVYDEDDSFRSRLSNENFLISNVVLEKDADPRVPLHEGRSDEENIKQLLQRHFEMTASPIAKEILDNFENELPKFVKIFPTEYYHALQAMQEAK